MKPAQDADWYRMASPPETVDDHSTWTVLDGPWPYSEVVKRGGWKLWARMDLPHD